uniref:Uncharacterized protein n=1 Tax=Anopheles merus TaxID=30066 RepID=A0A182VFV3_ANOME
MRCCFESEKPAQQGSDPLLMGRLMLLLLLVLLLLLLQVLMGEQLLMVMKMSWQGLLRQGRPRLSSGGGQLRFFAALWWWWRWPLLYATTTTASLQHGSTSGRGKVRVRWYCRHVRCHDRGVADEYSSLPPPPPWMSRNPSTSCGVVAGSSLHFCATCHFLFITRWRSFRKSRGGLALDSLSRFGDVYVVERRVASARGGGAGGPTLYEAQMRLGDGGTSCITTSSSKHTLRRSSTGDSAKETLFAGAGGGVATSAPEADPPSPPLYGGGALYGGAFRADGFSVFE